MATKPRTDADPIARAFRLKRKQQDARCAICGRVFTGLAGRRYCSNTCKVRAYRRRRAAQAETGQTG